MSALCISIMGGIIHETLFGIGQIIINAEINKQQMNKVLEFLDKQSKSFLLVSGSVFLLFIGFIDYVTGFDISLSIFYLIPISMVSWYVGKWQGILMSILGSIIWLIANKITAPAHIPFSILYWNSTVRLGFFLIISYFTTRLKDSSEKLKVALDKEKTLSRTDSLTKILNRRAFTESAETEIYRARRYKHPFTIVFMDLDNFKAVNDTFGHSAGDKLLDLVAQTIKNNMRSSDLIGRLGGDEFSILMPETGFESADISMRRLQLKLLDIMQRNGWPVTFSIGMVTYTTPPDSIEDIIRKADSVMYSVKNNGKNMIAHEVLS